MIKVLASLCVGQELADLGKGRLVAGKAGEVDVGDAGCEPAGLGNVVRVGRSAVRRLRLPALLGRSDAQPHVTVLVHRLEVGGHLLGEGLSIGEARIRAFARLARSIAA